jgi:hypothetical protein
MVDHADALKAATTAAEAEPHTKTVAEYTVMLQAIGVTAEHFNELIAAAQADHEINAQLVTDRPTPYMPPLAEDGMPEPGPDKTTTIRLDLGSVQGEAEIFISDDAAATATIAFGITTPDDCADWTVADAERVLAGLPVFEAQLRGLITKLASYQGGAR